MYLLIKVEPGLQDYDTTITSVVYISPDLNMLLDYLEQIQDKEYINLFDVFEITPKMLNTNISIIIDEYNSFPNALKFYNKYRGKKYKKTKD